MVFDPVPYIIEYGYSGVDGGINEETGPLALAAGADLLASGSTMVKSKNPEATYQKIIGSRAP